jgi:heptosyltransferase-2
LQNRINDLKKTVVIMPGDTSEFILALSTVTRMAAESENEILMIIEQHLAALCKILSPIPHILSDAHDRRGIDELNTIVKRETFEAVLDFSSFSTQSWLYPKLSSQKKVSLFEEKNKKSVSGQSIVRTHKTEDYSQLFGISAAEPHLWPGITIESDPEYEGMIVLCPGTVKGAGRHWPYFSDLIKYFSSQEFVILGDEGDIDLCKNLAPRLPHRVRNLAGKLSLADAGSVMSGALVVISNDSEYLHLSGYVGAPSIGLFGSSSPIRTRPLGSKSRTLYADILCSPCDMEVCSGMHLECMSRLTIDMVIKKMNELSITL